MVMAELAHAGPHEGAGTLLHVLTEPDHLLVVAGAVSVAVVARAVYRYVAARRKRRQYG